MCGITGIWSMNDGNLDMERLKSMTNLLIHRGPDGEGYWKDENEQIGFGHRRLAILDLTDNGNQPLIYQDRYVITYNGEIYNYLELREYLENRGHQFRSNTDTEVLLVAYAELGTQCLSRLDGMFAFAIYDIHNKTLFCARDRFGEKPFYYKLEKGKKFSFASEIKSLKGNQPLEIDKKILYNYLQYNVVSLASDPSKTFYSDIFNLEPAHYLLINRNGHVEKKKYWNLEINVQDIPFENSVEQFRELFYKSISRRLRSDVPVGSSLSGGLDSSSIVAAMQKIDNRMNQHTFSARFDEKELDEGYYINEIVSQYQLKEHHVYPSAESMLDQLDTIFYHQEEPYISASIYAQWEVMKLSKQEGVTVLLDGQGADETLAGYPRYYITYLNWLFKNNRKEYAKALKSYNDLNNSNLQFGLPFILRAYMPEVLTMAGKLKRKFFKSGNYNGLNNDLFNAYRNDDTPFTLPKNLEEDLYHSTMNYGLNKLLRFSDRNAMAFSREVRLPFLSHELVEFIFSLPSSHKLKDGWTKFLLRESMVEELPKDIRHRKDKIGFEPPQKKWLENDKMKEYIHLSNSFLIKQNIITSKSKISDWQKIMAYQLYQYCKV